ncbi:hypothetical protein [Rhizobium sp.]
MTDEMSARMIGTLQANSIAMQILMVALFETLEQKGVLAASDIIDTSDVAIRKLDDVLATIEPEHKWIYEEAQDRTTQIFGRAKETFIQSGRH